MAEPQSKIHPPPPSLTPLPATVQIHFGPVNTSNRGARLCLSAFTRRSEHASVPQRAISPAWKITAAPSPASCYTFRLFPTFRSPPSTRTASPETPDTFMCSIIVCAKVGKCLQLESILHGPGPGLVIQSDVGRLGRPPTQNS